MEGSISLPFDEERTRIRAKYALYCLIICIITLTVNLFPTIFYVTFMMKDIAAIWKVQEN
jgi:hypothetical protein